MVRTWTPEERAAQAERLRARKPWEKSTGPKTEAGKKASSRNAIKHGLTSVAGQAFYAALRETRDLLRLLRKIDKDEG